MTTPAIDTHVVKRGGARTTERFSPEKLHASVQAACLSVRSPEGEAEIIAHRVVAAASQWCYQKSTVTSRDIRRIAARGLELLHPEAAYLYQTHEMVV